MAPWQISGIRCQPDHSRSWRRPERRRALWICKHTILQLQRRTSAAVYAVEHRSGAPLYQQLAAFSVLYRGARKQPAAIALPTPERPEHTRHRAKQLNQILRSVQRRYQSGHPAGSEPAAAHHWSSHSVPGPDWCHNDLAGLLYYPYLTLINTTMQRDSATPRITLCSSGYATRSRKGSSWMVATRGPKPSTMLIRNCKICRDSRTPPVGAQETTIWTS